SGHVEISPDGGSTWQTISPIDGPAYDRLPDGSLGWSGNSLGWVNSTFGLNAYCHSTLNLRFVFKSDDVVQDAGWYLSDFLINASAAAAPTGPQFGTFARSGDAFYAYFESSGSAASLTTPAGTTTRVTYTGTTGD